MLNFMVKCSATVTPCVNYSTCNEICSFPACHPEGGLRSTFHVCSSGDELIWSCITKFGRWATVHKKTLARKKKNGHQCRSTVQKNCHATTTMQRPCKGQRTLARARNFTEPTPATAELRRHALPWNHRGTARSGSPRLHARGSRTQRAPFRKNQGAMDIPVPCSGTCSQTHCRVSAGAATRTVFTSQSVDIRNVMAKMRQLIRCVVRKPC